MYPIWGFRKIPATVLAAETLQGKGQESGGSPNGDVVYGFYGAASLPDVIGGVAAGAGSILILRLG